MPEAALAHANRDKVEATYERGDVLRKRRKLMDAWAQYCVGTRVGEGEETAENVAPIQAAERRPMGDSYPTSDASLTWRSRLHCK
jgi:hypothetical protein